MAIQDFSAVDEQQSAVSHTPPHPFTEADIGHTELAATHRIDLRPDGADVFYDANPVNDWAALTWKDIGKPYRVERWSKERKQWEQEHGQEMPVKTSWEMFNRSFQSLFDADAIAKRQQAMNEMGVSLKGLDLLEVMEHGMEAFQWLYWNKVHRIEDAVWDPRGKRALFGGLDVEKPEILFLGAADGYEAMQLMAMYPGGHAVLVDYDEYCVDGRFGAFPESYPFLGYNPAKGGHKVYYRDQMDIHYEVSDIRDLKYGKEFDIVVSIGLVEHFPDEYKPLAFEMHRRFLKPGGYAIITTPRLQTMSKIFYTFFADIMNFAYRELMDVTHLGKYAYDNGFDILRHGRIKAHNGLITKVR
ncbi:MAG: class I SAM-dependent methyltransferase [Anaerolineae bacterium]|nr:class I SAM-dependent methyltransferase [Anaerolineae bacterium]